MSDVRVKKQLFLLSILVLAGMIILVIFKSPRTLYASAEILEQSAVLKMKEERTEYMEDTLIGDLYYGETKLPYSDYNRTLYLSLSEGEVPDEEKFHVLLSDAGSDMKVVFEDFPEEEELSRAISDGTGFPLMLYDQEQYMECQVVFTGMPVLNVTFTDELDGAYTVVNMTLQSGIKGDGNVLESEAKMRARGGISINYPKLGFKLKLIERDNKGNSVKREESLLGLRKSDSWNLSALYADDTKVRDQVAIDIWDEMVKEQIPFDEPFATHMEYVEVIINDQYMGLYGLIEPIDEDQLGIGDHGQTGLCEYYYKKEGEVIAQESDFLFDATETVPLKEDGAADMILAGLELKNGNGHMTKLAWEPVRRYMEMIRNESFEQTAESLLDLENVADTWIYIQTIVGVDNRAKNLYYCAKVIDGDYKIYFVPWDMDMTWGNETDLSQETLQSYYTYPVDKIMNWSPATQLIEGNVGNIRGIIKERWAQLREGALSEDTVLEAMDEKYFYINSQGSYSRNAQRWSGSPHAEDISQIKEYAAKRLQILDEYINNTL